MTGLYFSSVREFHLVHKKADPLPPLTSKSGGVNYICDCNRLLIRARINWDAFEHWFPLEIWQQDTAVNIGVGAQSTLGGTRHFCPKIYAWKINKISEFYTFFCPKNIFPEFFFWGGEASVPCPPSPMPMAVNFEPEYKDWWRWLTAMTVRRMKMNWSELYVTCVRCVYTCCRCSFTPKLRWQMRGTSNLIKNTKTDQ